jgi:hypothetical protein
MSFRFGFVDLFSIAKTPFTFFCFNKKKTGQGGMLFWLCGKLRDVRDILPVQKSRIMTKQALCGTLKAAMDRYILWFYWFYFYLLSLYSYSALTLPLLCS